MFVADNSNHLWSYSSELGVINFRKNYGMPVKPQKLMKKQILVWSATFNLQMKIEGKLLLISAFLQ